jgi:hypothetical protein
LYPKTDKGRRRFVSHSLHCNFWYLLLIVIGVAGLILSAILCFKGIDWKGSFLTAILSLLLFYFGVTGIERRSE